MVPTLLVVNVLLMAGVIGMLAVLVRRSRADQPPAAPAEPVTDTRAPAQPGGDRQVTPPPMIDGVTLRDWMIHYNPLRDQVWSRVVAEFYHRAAAVPEVADYFRDAEMERLQQHFTGVLTLVASRGLTAGMIQRLRDRHLNVLASDGQPITAQVYDAVIQTLADVLAAEKVPRRGIESLAETIAPLRAEIVRA